MVHAAPPARRPPRAWWAPPAIGLLLLGGGLFALRDPAVHRLLAARLERVIAAQLGVHLALSAVELDPVGRGLRVAGLALRAPEPDGGLGPVWLSVEELWVGLDWRDGRPALGHVEITAPSLRLHVDSGGVVELRSLPLDRFGGEPAAPAAAPQELPWASLRVTDAWVELVHPVGVLRADHVDLVPQPGNPSAMRLELGAVTVQRDDFVQVAEQVVVPGLTLRPDRLIVPAVALSFPALDLSASLDLVPGGAIDARLDLDADLVGISPVLGPRLGAEGALRVGGRLTGTLAAPVAQGRLAADDFVLLQLDEEVPGLWRRRSLGDLRSDWSFDGRQAALGPLEARWAGGTLTIEGGYDVFTSGLFLQASGRGISLQDALADTSVHEQAWVEMGTDLDLVVGGTLEPLRLVGTLDLRADQLVVGDGPVGAPGTAALLSVPAGGLFAELDVHPDRFRIHAQRFGTARSEAEVDAWVYLTPGTPLDIAVNFRRLALDELAPLGSLGLKGQGQLRGRLAGPASALRLTGDLDVSGFVLSGVPYADRLRARIDTPDLSVLRFVEIDALRGQSPYTGHVFVHFDEPGVPLDIRAEVVGGRLSDFTGMFLEIPGLEAQLDGGLSLRGPYDHFDGEGAFALSAVDLFGEPFPEGEVRARMVGGRFLLDGLSLSRLDGLETLLARGSIGAGWATNIDVQSGGLRLERMHLLHGLPLWGEVDLSATVGGTLFAPAPRGAVRVSRSAIGQRKVDDSVVRFDTTGTTLRYAATAIGEDLRLNGDLQLDGVGAWTVDARAAGFPLDVFYPRAPDGSPVKASVDGALKGGGTLAGDQALRATLDAELTAVRLDWGTHSLRNPTPWVVEWNQGTFELRGVALEGGATALTFTGAGDRRGELALSGGGTLDLDLLRLVTPGIERASGLAKVGLTVGGPAGNAVPKVKVDVSGASFLTAYFPQPFEEVQAQLSASPDGFVVESATGRLGGGAVDLRGQIAADAWVPAHFDLRANVEDARVRYLSFLPPMEGDARLRFDGPVDDLLLAGDIIVQDMVFAERIDWEDWLLQFGGDRLAGAAADQTGDYFGLNLKITADNTIRMRNNIGDLSASANLRFVGDTSKPGLLGDVRAQPGGRVYLKEREFEITRADLHFGDPFAFDPELDIALATTVRAREDTYAIDYRVLGPYSDWTTDSSSDPGLPPADINSLLLFGMTSSEMERYGGAAGALMFEGSDLVASKLGVIERVGERIYGLELIRPERIDLVTGVNERGSGTVSSDMRLLVEKDFDWGTLIFEQNLYRTSDTYLGFEKRLARKLYTRAYWAREQVGRRLNIGGAYGAELNLRWELD